MSSELSILLIAAASIGFFHTLFGPDHYLPFIVMSKSGQWSMRKTTLITFICGLGHVLSSVVFGIIGVVFGVAITKLEALEAFRGNLAAWALIAFGLVYFAWGLRQAYRNRPHLHIHSHQNGIKHEHLHEHQNEHVHAHPEKANITPWILFTIFIFGPCEPLIPLLMYPAAKVNLWSLVFVTTTFGVVTIATMLSIVLISAFGISFLPISKLSRYTHAMAGLTLFLSGIAIQFLGL
ncbi:MAG: sulfite exporter TauE/SafE family protein [Candidatus Marinimicrobia bacterium]|nr:sulfite exporter TauE/SafE family protein [Candidatus Neomarinimicrobiota bacterium]